MCFIYVVYKLTALAEEDCKNFNILSKEKKKKERGVFVFKKRKREKERRKIQNIVHRIKDYEHFRTF